MLVTCLCNRLHNVCDCKIVDQLHKCHLVEIHSTCFISNMSKLSAFLLLVGNTRIGCGVSKVNDVQQAMLMPVTTV